MPAIQETMKKGISSLSTNPTGQQMISIITIVAIPTSRTAPLNFRSAKNNVLLSVVSIQPISTKFICTCVQQNNRPPICKLPKTSSQNGSQKIKYRTIPITLLKRVINRRLRIKSNRPLSLPQLYPPFLSFSLPSYSTPLIIDVNINFVRIRIAPDNVFGSNHSLALPRVANESLSPLPKAFGETLHGSNHNSSSVQRGTENLSPDSTLKESF